MPATDDLAALRDGRRYQRRDEQPRTLKLDVGLSLELPGPHLLARVYALPRLRERLDVFRVSGDLAARLTGSTDEPTAVAHNSAVDGLLAAIVALPDRADAGRPYRDLQLFVTHAEPSAVASYLGETVAAVRFLSPQWRPPRPPVERGPAQTAAQRMAAKRERDRTAEIASARWWLDLLVDEPDDELATGDRVTAAALYDLASNTLADLLEDDELLYDDDPASVVRVPGPRVFYSVADELLGARRRGTNGAQTYTIPPAHNLARARSLMRQGRRAQALLLQREHHGRYPSR